MKRVPKFSQVLRSIQEDLFIQNGFAIFSREKEGKKQDWSGQNNFAKLFELEKGQSFENIHDVPEESNQRTEHAFRLDTSFTKQDEVFSKGKNFFILNKDSLDDFINKIKTKQIKDENFFEELKKRQDAFQASLRDIKNQKFEEKYFKILASNQHNKTNDNKAVAFILWFDQKSQTVPEKQKPVAA